MICCTVHLHLQVFKNHKQEGEHQLKYTEIFSQYEALVDGHLSEFAATKNLDLPDVYATLQKVQHLVHTNGSYAL
jgi:hypothetical protein